MIRDAGFDATALWWEEDKAHVREMRDLAPELVRNAGLHLDNFHVPYRRCADLWSDDADARHSVVKEHVGWVRDCGRHDVARMVMHVSLGSGTPPPNAHGTDSIRRILDAGYDENVEISIENTRSPAHVAYLLENIEAPLLTLCYDSSHDRLYSPEPLELLERFSHRLGATHLSDTDGKLDRHWLPGEGVVDFDALANRLSGEGYGGTYLLETVPKDRTEDAESFLRTAYERLAALLPGAVSENPPSRLR